MQAGKCKPGAAQEEMISDQSSKKLISVGFLSFSLTKSKYLLSVSCGFIFLVTGLTHRSLSELATFVA